MPDPIFELLLQFFKHAAKTVQLVQKLNLSYSPARNSCHTLSSYECRESLCGVKPIQSWKAKVTITRARQARERSVVQTLLLSKSARSTSMP
jgi:hypothetical protein